MSFYSVAATHFFSDHLTEKVRSGAIFGDLLGPA
jgi:hypothetical protein